MCGTFRLQLWVGFDTLQVWHDTKGRLLGIQGVFGAAGFGQAPRMDQHLPGVATLQRPLVVVNITSFSKVVDLCVILPGGNPATAVSTSRKRHAVKDR